MYVNILLVFKTNYHYYILFNFFVFQQPNLNKHLTTTKNQEKLLKKFFCLRKLKTQRLSNQRLFYTNFFFINYNKKEREKATGAKFVVVYTQLFEISQQHKPAEFYNFFAFFYVFYCLRVK